MCPVHKFVITSKSHLSTCLISSTFSCLVFSFSLSPPPSLSPCLLLSLSLDTQTHRRTHTYILSSSLPLSLSLFFPSLSLSLPSLFGLSFLLLRKPTQAHNVKCFKVHVSRQLAVKAGVEFPCRCFSLGHVHQVNLRRTACDYWNHRKCKCASVKRTSPVCLDTFDRALSFGVKCVHDVSVMLSGVRADNGRLYLSRQPIGSEPSL